MTLVTPSAQSHNSFLVTSFAHLAGPKVSVCNCTAHTCLEPSGVNLFPSPEIPVLFSNHYLPGQEADMGSDSGSAGRLAWRLVVANNSFSATLLFLTCELVRYPFSGNGNCCTVRYNCKKEAEEKRILRYSLWNWAHQTGSDFRKSGEFVCFANGMKINDIMPGRVAMLAERFLHNFMVMGLIPIYGTCNFSFSRLR